MDGAVIEPERPAEPGPVKVTCPDCGHVRVAPTDVRLVVTEAPGSSFYVFTCPGCEKRVRREVTKDVAGALLARRVPAVRSVSGG
jgi:ribosomal protein S27E